MDALLTPLAARFPFPCRIGAPLLFGRAKVVMARLVVPTIELLEVHDEVCRMCLPHLQPGPLSNAVPGRWTAHVTLARRLVPAQLGRALRIAGKAGDHWQRGLRRWDGSSKREYPIA